MTIKQIEKTHNFYFTKHAIGRLSARGIPAAGIVEAIYWGREYYHKGRNVYRLDRRMIKKAKSVGKELMHFEGIHVICKHDYKTTIITAYKNRKGRKIKT